MLVHSCQLFINNNFNLFSQVIFICILLGLAWEPVEAQVIPDNTLGAESSTVNSVGEIGNLIEGGATRDLNLFHSFQEFNIGNGDSVTFANSEGFKNIFARITGKNISHIFGEIGIEGEANLFLVNPQGIIFGENASLNVNGSFIATTAENIQFEDGTKFSASNPQSTLTINIPIGLGFGSDSGNITVKNTGHNLDSVNPFNPAIGFTPFVDSTTIYNGLQVGTSQTLALLGGNIDFQGGITIADSGNLEIGSVKDGSVGIISQNEALKFDYSHVSQFSDINLNSRSLLDASGIKGGSINIYGNHINVNDFSIAIIENRGENTPSGNLTVRASNSLRLELQDPNETSSGVLTTHSLFSGAIPNIILNTNELNLSHQAGIGTVNFNNGIGGNILVDSREITVADESTFGSINLGVERGGSISVKSHEITILEGSSFGSLNFGDGTGGNVSIDSDSLVVSGVASTGFPYSTISASTVNSGAAGDLLVNVSSLIVNGGAEVSSSTLGTGLAGTVTVNSSESIEVEGTSFNNNKPSQIVAGVNDIDVNEIPIFNLIFANNSLGVSGNIVLNTPQLLILDGASVTTRNSGLNNAGNIALDALTITLDNSGTISASTISGQGGNIYLNSERLEVLNQSQISASAGGTGDGGNITIDSDTIVGLENSNITANAVEGNGGEIRLSSTGVFLDSDSQITASSQLGIDGTIEINTPDINLQKELEATEPQIIVTPEAIANSCLSQRDRSTSLILGGTGGLPQNPNSSYNSTTFSLTGINFLPTLPTKIPVPNTQSFRATDLALIPADTIVRTKDGRTLLVSKARVAKPVFCQPLS